MLADKSSDNGCIGMSVLDLDSECQTPMDIITAVERMCTTDVVTL